MQTKRKSLKRLLIKETLRALLIWMVLVVAFGAFQVGLYRHTVIDDLQEKLVGLANQQAPRLASFLTLNEEAAATRQILKNLKAEHRLGGASISQSFFTHWPEEGCALVSSNVEVCKSFWTGEVRTRSLLQTSDQATYLHINKSLNQPFGSWGWWAASVMGFLSTMFILAILFLRLIFVLRSEVLLPARELIDVLSLPKAHRRWWFKGQVTEEFEQVARKLFSQQEDIERKSVFAEVGKVSTQVAHDIRGPLSLLQVITDQDRTEITMQELVLARQAVQRIDEVTEDLLRLKSQISERHQSEDLLTAIPDEHQKARDLCWVICRVKEFIDQKAALAPSRNIRYDLVTTDVQPKSLRLKVDAAALLRSIENLIRNAEEACAVRGEDGSSIRIRIQFVLDELLIEVFDTGCGMSEMELKKIAVGEEFTTKPTGHGIGASKTRRWVNENGGRMSAWSIKGGGTLVQLSFPL